MVRVPTSFASQWIAPRLDLFRSEHPDIDLRLTALDQGDSKIDVEIRFGMGEWPRYESTLLLRDEAFPVCAPQYALKLHVPGDLGAGDLLHVPGYDEDWDTWLGHVGVHDIDTAAGSFFDQSIMAIRAAVEGKGVLLGRSALVERELASGLLVAPFSQRLQANGSYWLLVTPQKAKSAKVAAFKEALLRMTRSAQPI
mgnify:CR=1 FL=1